uniref:Secreted protein n=1 Tax=Trichogramma kaykai TaxID=54128 RepID=A0ABD2WWH1_9HYME
MSTLFFKASLFIPRVRTNAVCSCMYPCPSTYTYIIWRIYVKIYTYRALCIRRCAAGRYIYYNCTNKAYIKLDFVLQILEQ